LNGILQSFTGSAWTLTFLRLTGQDLPVLPPQPVDAAETIIEAP
jgi:hypothetical protein